jgi:BMFP domain-containing protein YqiC
MKSIVATLIALSVFQPAFATSSEEVKQKTAEATSAAANYTKEQKDQFQKDMSAKLDTLGKEIDDMKKAAAQKTGEAKKEMDAQIANLEKKQEGMKQDMAKLQKSSGKAWGHMKTGMSKAWDSLSDSYAKAKAEYVENK